MFNREAPLRKPLVSSTLFIGHSMAGSYRTRSQGLSDAESQTDRPQRRSNRSTAGQSPRKRTTTLPVLRGNIADEDDDDEDQLAQDARTGRRFEQPDPALPPIGGKADFSYGSTFRSTRDLAAGIDHKDTNADISNLVADKVAENVVAPDPAEQATLEVEQSNTTRPVRSTRAASKTPSKAANKTPSKATRASTRTAKPKIPRNVAELQAAPLPSHSTPLLSSISRQFTSDWSWEGARKIFNPRRRDAARPPTAQDAEQERPQSFFDRHKYLIEEFKEDARWYGQQLRYLVAMTAVNFVRLLFLLAGAGLVAFTLLYVVRGASEAYQAIPEGALFDRLPSSFPSFSDISLPSWPSIPLTHLPDDVVRGIYNRLSTVERQIVSLQKQQSLHHSTIETIQKTLPSKIAVHKNKRGEIEFPLDFWNALKSKIDSDLRSQGFGITRKDVELYTQGEMQSQWDEFLLSNTKRIDEMVHRSLGRMPLREWKTNLHHNHILDEGMLEKALDKQYEKVHAEIAEHSRAIEDKYRRFDKSVEKTASSVATQVAKSVTGVWQRHIASAQLDALAQASQRESAATAMTQVNFFSPALGAVVNPHLSSTTYRKRHPFHHRLLNRFIGLGIREPLPPVAALERWEEVGDCWCTSPAGSRIPQLTVILPEQIIPHQITIEHIPASATLDPGAAPRWMELWASIPDPAAREEVGARAEKILGASTSSPSKNELDNTFVRLARFKYDIYALSNIQTFGMLADLKALGASTNELAVRPVGNWGAKEFTCLYRVRLHGELAHKKEASQGFLYDVDAEEGEPMEADEAL